MIVAQEMQHAMQNQMGHMVGEPLALGSRVALAGFGCKGAVAKDERHAVDIRYWQGAYCGQYHR